MCRVLKVKTLIVLHEHYTQTYGVFFLTFTRVEAAFMKDPN